ncbi:MAG: putative dehydrogenase [Pseudohongiellaceae bacterium]
MSAPRVAIIGARRRRQGLGPFVAKQLLTAGAEVAGIVGTSPETVAAGVADLRQSLGLELTGATSLRALLETEHVDAVAILTPAETHAEQLAAALDSGLSVLCEKPFVWGTPDDLQTTTELVEAFSHAGLLLHENCQWPFTLPAFDALHPGLREQGPPSRFSMNLGPSVTGPATIGDSLPHAISLLQAIAPATRAELSDVNFSTRDETASELTVSFSWPADAGPVQATVELSQEAEQPRRAGYSIDGHQAARMIRSADYAQFFGDGARLVDVPDPLGQLIAAFVAALEVQMASSDPAAKHGSTPGLRYDMIERMRALTGLAQAYRIPTS